MTDRKKIFNLLQPIFRMILKDRKLILKENTNASKVKNWDSLNHLTLIVEIEKQLNCNFTTKELGKLNNVGNFVDLIIKKTTNVK
jgi:acyl carrier protein